MKIEKAIEILRNILLDVSTDGPLDQHDALKLGIEALKRLRDHRNGFPLPPSTLLPGETDE